MANQVNDLMSQLDTIGEKRKVASASSSSSASRNYGDDDRGRDSKRSRRQVSVSPPRASKPQLDDRPIIYKIYDGRVSNLRDFGAFVQLEGVAGRQEGTPRRTLATHLVCILIYIDP